MYWYVSLTTINSETHYGLIVFFVTLHDSNDYGCLIRRGTTFNVNAALLRESWI